MQEFENKVFDEMLSGLEDLYEDHIIIKGSKKGKPVKILSWYKDGFIQEKNFSKDREGVALALQVPYDSLGEYFDTMDEIFTDNGEEYIITCITYDDDYNRRIYSVGWEYS